MIFAWWWKIIKQYLRNCNIHGVKYLADDRLTYIERLFWLIFCVLSWLGCIATIYSNVRQYRENPVALTVDTNFYNWQTPFPAIFFCISTSPTIQKYFKRNPGLLGNFSKAKYLTATAEDLLSIYDTIRVPCTQLLAECRWGKMKFNCCEEFQELRKTGIGYCLGMNTYHLKKNGKPNVNFFLNRTFKYGDLVIDINANAKIKRFLLNGFSAHVFSNVGVPLFGDVEIDEIHVKPGKVNIIDFTVDHTYNENGVRDIAIEHRKCRFYDEPPANSAYEAYSKYTCYLDRLVEFWMKTCGCVNFYYYVPPWARTCNATEMLCLISHKSEIKKLLEEDADCLSNCDGSLITANRHDPVDLFNLNQTIVRLQVTAVAHPTLRFHRYVSNSFLDLIVSVGSAIGLFMGASILSIFEIPYWLFIRRDKIT